MNDILISAHKLCKSLKSLHEEVNEIKAKDSDQYHQADFIKASKRPYGRKAKVIALSLPLLAGLAIFIARYKLTR